MTTRDQFPLSTKKIIKKSISGTIGQVILFAFLEGSLLFISRSLTESVSTSFSSYTGLIQLGLLLLIAGGIIFNYIYQLWYFKSYYYNLTSDFVVIRKGVLATKEITIPYERVQDVYVDQDLIDRLFGLYDVHLSTATSTSGMQAHIDGVEKAAAEGLRQLLIDSFHAKQKSR